MFNFLRKSKDNLEVKSLNDNQYGNLSTQLLFDTNGLLIGEYKGSDRDAIIDNVSTQTIINKQFAIISQPDFVVKEKTDKGDIIINQDADNKPFNDFLNWIYNPNTYPSPNSKDHILKYLLNAQYVDGIYGVVFVFDSRSKKNLPLFKNIFLPNSISCQRILDKTSYRVNFNNKNFEFNLSTKYGCFAHEDNEHIYLLQVDGNFDNLKNTYKSEFSSVIKYVRLQNVVANFALSFYSNSCFPSQIVTVNYTNLPEGQRMTDGDRKKFDEAVENIKQLMKSNKGKSSGAILPTHPNIEVKVTPLNISANADEVTKFDLLAAEKIFSYPDQGSYSVFMGKDEYSNNAIMRIKQLYEATLRTFNYMALKPMTKAMQTIIRYYYPTIDVSRYYISLNTAGIRVFQDAFIKLAIQLNQNNLYKINELRKVIGETNPDFAQFGEDPELDVVNAQLSGNKTKSSPEELKAINTKPTERMAEIAKRALEWRAEYNRGGTEVGVARARDISNRANLSEETINRMVSYFARHEVDKKAKGFHEGEEGFPSAGRIAWDLWGGNSGRVWALQKQLEFNKD